MGACRVFFEYHLFYQRREGEARVIVSDRAGFDRQGHAVRYYASGNRNLTGRSGKKFWIFLIRRDVLARNRGIVNGRTEELVVNVR